MQQKTVLVNLFSLTRRIYSDMARADRDYLRLGSPHQWRNFITQPPRCSHPAQNIYLLTKKTMKNQYCPRYRVFIRVCGFLIARGQRLCLLSLVSSLSSGGKRQSLYRDLLKLQEGFFIFPLNPGWTCGIFSMFSFWHAFILNAFTIKGQERLNMERGAFRMGQSGTFFLHFLKH